jgi:hypothetical protein
MVGERVDTSSVSTTSTLSGAKATKLPTPRLVWSFSQSMAEPSSVVAGKVGIADSAEAAAMA